ncbi:MAG: galactose system component [Tepidanaerobacteraceae bacterium]|nr:galactose system component [Tepidanaerobacteraceae bacterium]
MISEISDLFRKDLIFIIDEKNAEDIFKNIGKVLFNKGLVNEGFIDAIIKREKEFPTGLNLNVLDNDEIIPNVAIPHTESEYCNSKNIVVVKLKNEVLFKNMIKPEEELKVKFIFIILNDMKGKQTNILSNLIEFLMKKDNIINLNKLEDTNEIYNYILNKT